MALPMNETDYWQQQAAQRTAENQAKPRITAPRSPYLDDEETKRKQNRLDDQATQAEINAARVARGQFVPPTWDDAFKKSPTKW